MYRAAFPDATNSVEGIVAEGDTVVARWTARGTHGGDFLGIAATGKEATFALLSLYRLQNGKIVEICDRFDVLVVLQQLGVSAVPAAAMP
jgi:predicted ester cyclase